MKKLILTLSIGCLAFGVQAQEAEIEACHSAFSAKNYSEALTQAKKADSLLASNVTVSAEDRAKFYFDAGQAAKASGDLGLAATYFAKVNAIESSPFWKVKNKDSKNWEYFFDKAAGEKAIAAGNYAKMKESKLSTSLLSGIANEINTEANQALNAGNAAFKSKKYDVAGKEFMNAYNLYNAVGKKNELIKYYSAISLLQTDDKQTAAELLQSLLDSGYDGVQTSYVATDKEGKDVTFNSETEMDLYVKAGNASNPRVEKSESIEEDLISNTALAWNILENYDKALEVGEAGLAKYPNNETMNQIVSSAYIESGNTDKFIKSLEAKVANGSANATDYFNLAKSLDDAGSDDETVKGYYQSAINAAPNDPENFRPYLNLALLIVEAEKEYVDLMNANLGTSSKEKKIYNENMAKRESLYQEALPLLEKAYELSPENLGIIRYLEKSYDVLGMDDKYFEFKKMYEEKSRQ